MRIRDAGVQRLAADLESRQAPIGDADVLRLLAELADGPRDAAALLKDLSRPGVSRAEQLSLLQSGLDADELADVKTLLDESTMRLSPAARNLLEAAVGRASLDAHAPGLQLDQTSAGRFEGLAMPGAIIEAVNLSTAATGPGRVTDGVELGRADDRGRFSLFMGDAQQGDQVRVRARSVDGRASDWFTVTTQTGQADLRAAFVNLRRVLARTSPDGTVSVIAASKDLPFTEPHATVRFSNQRTGEFVDVKMGDFATLVTPVVLEGQPGDAISVSVSDGQGNTDFSFVAGSLTAPGFPPRGAIDDPGAVARDGTPPTFVATGDLFVGGVSVHDPKQGQIGNCYVPAALAAIAHADPKAIEDLIRPNADGTVTVRFFDAQTLTPHEVVVDRDLYGFSGRTRYGGATQRDANGAAETWFSLVEKAYASWRGSYDVVAQGGSVGRLQSEVLGRPNVEHWLNTGLSADTVFSTIQAGASQQRAMAAGTYPTQEASRYTNSGLYANHAYSVLGAKEENGQKLVTLRNPWASGEPGRDGADDGVFDLPLQDFMRLFLVLNVT